MILPTLKYERRLWKQGYLNIAGVDEVGVGPWAGPVVAGAMKVKSLRLRSSSYGGQVKSKVKSQKIFKYIRDSKLLDWKRREEVYKFLTESDWAEWGIGVAEVVEIDKWGLGEARRMAMKRAIEKIKPAPDFLLIDAVKLKEYQEISESIVKGDAKIFSIACASIVAKVTRDRMMRKLAQKYPYWGFDKHKGYGTKFHQEMIQRYGISPIHRKTFEPIKEVWKLRN